uniref:Mu-conotoxin-like Am3.1 n=1 Tax=Conus amadis TaxID=198732 RepID=CM31_CONAA|nr:RecName: Full=Mu-conotoxin-like Am3.1; Flags: Precursor [Conus amadis]AYP73021.1 conotoxin precursor protein [Conus amadis]
MMSKLRVLLIICLLLFPLTAVPLDGDQPADRPAERTQDDISSEHHPMFDAVRGCCPALACAMGCRPCCG